VDLSRDAPLGEEFSDILFGGVRGARVADAPGIDGYIFQKVAQGIGDNMRLVFYNHDKTYSRHFSSRPTFFE
jgi:hypothetical protein